MNDECRTAIADEREVCAVLAENWPCGCKEIWERAPSALTNNRPYHGYHFADCERAIGQAIAEAIRARSKM